MVLTLDCVLAAVTAWLIRPSSTGRPGQGPDSGSVDPRKNLQVNTFPLTYLTYTKDAIIRVILSHSQRIDNINYKRLYAASSLYSLWSDFCFLTDIDMGNYYARPGFPTTSSGGFTTLNFKKICHHYYCGQYWCILKTIIVIVPTLLLLNYLTTSRIYIFNENCRLLFALGY